MSLDELYGPFAARPAVSPVGRFRDLGFYRRIAVKATRPAVAFACLWDQIPERTWSYTPWNLRAGLALAADVIDIGVQIPPVPRTLLKALYMRPSSGRLTSTWKYSKLTDTYCDSVLHRGLSRWNR